MAAMEASRNATSIRPIGRLSTSAADAKPTTASAGFGLPADFLPDTYVAAAQVGTQAKALGIKVAATVGITQASVEEKASGLWGSIKSGFSSAKEWVSEKATKVFQAVSRVVMGNSFSNFETRATVDDPTDVNSVNAGEHRGATQETAKNRALEENALKALSAPQQTQYKALRELSEANPMARQALQELLLDQKLTTGPDLKGGGDLLAHLDGLRNQPLLAGIDRQALLCQVIAECENPVRINQHSVGTCGATTAQIFLIRKNPAEYVRLLEGLASPEGKAQLKGGARIERADDWLSENDGNRSISSRLFQPALMDVGQVPLLNYDNSEDKGKLGPIPIHSGLFALAGLISETNGKDYDDHWFFSWNRNSEWDKTKASLTRGEGPLPTAMVWDGGGGHFVQIDKVEDGWVHFTNPHGKREKMDENEFKSHVTAVTRPDFK